MNDKPLQQQAREWVESHKGAMFGAAVSSLGEPLRSEVARLLDESWRSQVKWQLAREKMEFWPPQGYPYEAGPYLEMPYLLMLQALRRLVDDEDKKAKAPPWAPPSGVRASCLTHTLRQKELVTWAREFLARNGH